MSLKPHLSKIDKESMEDHSYLRENDKCFYFGEYTAKEDWNFSDTNQLILNFKKDMSTKGTPQWKYKIKAIEKVGKLIAPYMKRSQSNWIWVPTPPSKVTTDPNYDSRIEKALKFAKQISHTDTNICNCITQNENREADHKTSNPKPSPEQRAENYTVNSNKIPDNTTRAIIVDDVLTTGSHFKGMEIALQKIFPDIEVIGLFVARRVPLPLYE